MSEITNSELLSLDANRRQLYSFLSIVFNGPLSMETLKYWKENLSSEFFSAVAEDNENLQIFFDELENKELEAIFNREKEAYLATFDLFNPQGKIPAPPWESVYVTSDRALFGDPVIHIRQKLHQFGLRFIKENSEPEDHIAIELEFMTFLINHTSDAAKSNNKFEFERGIYNQYWLLKEHLTKWIDPFAKDIHSSETTTFYKGIAELLALFVAEDFEYIKSLKEELENE